MKNARPAIGQIWMDNDPRTARHLRIVGFGTGTFERHVICERVVPSEKGGWLTLSRKEKPMLTKIAIHQLRPTRNGYRLVEA
jgi:hypothetical protein